MTRTIQNVIADLNHAAVVADAVSRTCVSPQDSGRALLIAQRIGDYSRQMQQDLLTLSFLQNNYAARTKLNKINLTAWETV